VNFFLRLIQNYDLYKADCAIHQLLKGIGKAKPSVYSRLPNILERLLILLRAIPSVTVDPFITALYETMFTTAFFGFLRIGEMTASVHCLSFASAVRDSAGFTLLFYSCKGFDSAVPLRVTLAPRLVAPCPVSTLDHYIRLRGSISGPLFCLMVCLFRALSFRNS
jgi:hypothetical protein